MNSRFAMTALLICGFWAANADAQLAFGHKQRANEKSKVQKVSCDSCGSLGLGGACNADCGCSQGCATAVPYPRCFAFQSPCRPNSNPCCRTIFHEMRCDLDRWLSKIACSGGLFGGFGGGCGGFGGGCGGGCGSGCGGCGTLTGLGCGPGLLSGGGCGGGSVCACGLGTCGGGGCGSLGASLAGTGCGLRGLFGGGCGCSDGCSEACEPECGIAEACEPECGIADAGCGGGCSGGGCGGGGLLSGLLFGGSCGGGSCGGGGCSEPAMPTEPSCGMEDACFQDLIADNSCGGGCSGGGSCGLVRPGLFASIGQMLFGGGGCASGGCASGGCATGGCSGGCAMEEPGCGICDAAEPGCGIADAGEVIIDGGSSCGGGCDSCFGSVSTPGPTYANTKSRPQRTMKYMIATKPDGSQPIYVSQQDVARARQQAQIAARAKAKAEAAARVATPTTPAPATIKRMSHGTTRTRNAGVRRMSYESPAKAQSQTQTRREIREQANKATARKSVEKMFSDHLGTTVRFDD